MDFGTRLMFSMFLGAIGLGYFIYGKRQQQIIPMLAGIALCIFPYFISTFFATVVMGLILIAIPWIIRF